MYRNSKKNVTSQKITPLTVRENSELMSFLISKMGGMSRNSIKSLLAHGQVLVNNKIVSQFNHPLIPGDTVCINRKRTAISKQPEGLRILYEDDDIVVIDKKAGLLTVTVGSGIDTTAFSILKAHVRQYSPQAKIFIVHRLDRQTSGVLVFAKSSDVQHAFRDNWRDMVIKRTYVAVVEGKVEEESDRIITYLTQNPKTHIVYSDRNNNGGKEAITNYRRMQYTDDFSLLEIELETGRKNQIRVHMKDIGHPIVGDRMYGSSMSIDRIALHAGVLEFYHPVTRERMRFEAPMPKEFLKLMKQNKATQD